MDDVTQLLQLWHAGDNQAFEELYPEIRGSLEAIVRKTQARLGRPGLISDQSLLQDAFVRLLGNKPEFRNRIAFFGWMKRVVRNLVLDQAKAKRNAADHNLPLEKAGAEVQNILTTLWIEEAITDLEGSDPFLAQLFEYKYFLEMTAEEIAELHRGEDGWSLSNIQKALPRAKKHVERYLSASQALQNRS